MVYIYHGQTRASLDEHYSNTVTDCESSHIPCFPVLRCLNCLAGSAHAAAGRFSWEVPSSLEAMNNGDMGFVPVFALSDGAFALKIDNH